MAWSFTRYAWQVELFVDERYAGYSKLLYRTHPRGHFTGFLVAGGQLPGSRRPAWRPAA
jgi:hypothetical protein